MARIFSIHFLHEGLTQTGMVAVRKTPFFIEYTISMLDEEIVALLPGSKILSYSSNHFVFANATLDHSTELMRNIINAISQHAHSLA
jgi:hypothetical protein